MTTPPPGAPLQGSTGPYPQPSAWGSPPGYPPMPPPGPRPARKKKRTGLILGLGGIVFIVVIALVAGILILANRNKTQPTASHDPTVTATYAGETSPWVGHLPDPCKDFPANVVKSIGLDPNSRRSGAPNHSYTVQRSCQYRSPISTDIRTLPTSWGVLIIYQSFSFQEVLDNKSRDNYRTVTINGQRGTFYHIKDADMPDITRCDLSIGTTFGNVNFVGQDDVDKRLSYSELCTRTLTTAKALQPYISNPPAPK